MEACGRICMLARPSAVLAFSSRRQTVALWNPSCPLGIPQMQARFKTNGLFRIHRSGPHSFTIRMLSSQSGGGQSEKIETVSVQAAQELLNSGHCYLDVRTPEEFQAGHIAAAINVPYMKRSPAGMTKNANFVEEVSKRLSKSDPFVVGCQAGKRSHMASSELAAAGFTRFVDMSSGYGGWVNSGLPTTTD